jgi:hypothetical protein
MELCAASSIDLFVVSTGFASSALWETGWLRKHLNTDCEISMFANDLLRRRLPGKQNGFLPFCSSCQMITRLTSVGEDLLPGLAPARLCLSAVLLSSKLLKLVWGVRVVSSMRSSGDCPCVVIVVVVLPVPFGNCSVVKSPSSISWRVSLVNRIFSCE